MIDHHILEDLVVTFAIGLVLVVGLARVRVPAIVALMIAGIVAGPSGLRIVDSPARVEMLAEIGVVLLLFTVGLDFSLATVKQIWQRILIGGSAADRAHGRARRSGAGGDRHPHSAGDLHRPVRRAVRVRRSSSTAWRRATSSRRRTAA